MHIVHNDSLSPRDLHEVLPYFSAVVIGPGPGSPSDSDAVGVIPTLWRLSDIELIPVLGVCLGHQSLCIAHGGTLKRLPEVKHGLKSPLQHDSQDIFENIGDADVVRYHSLHVDISCLGDEAEIIPLAWTMDELPDGSRSKILMAARHYTKPFWGVQYHPESICTSGGGEDVVRKFWGLADAWNQQHSRSRLAPLPVNWRTRLSSMTDLHPVPLVPKQSGKDNDRVSPAMGMRHVMARLRNHISVPNICELLRAQNNMSADGDFVVLDSSSPPGRFSIIGLLDSATQCIFYTVGDHSVTLRTGGEVTRIAFSTDEDPWGWLARFMDARRCTGGDPLCPFWGGLVGIANYEMGVASLGVPIRARQGSSTSSINQSDLSFAFIERSVVIDHQKGTAYIQSIVPTTMNGEHAWLHSTRALLEAVTEPAFTPAPTPPVSPDTESSTFNPCIGCPTVEVDPPNEYEYLDKISQVQEYLKAGDSYEICLTALTRITISSLPHSLSGTGPHGEYRAWRLFKALRALNPAPHGSYIRLGGTTLVGSSPERFISWSRDGLCQLRPIKGTIKKTRPGLPALTIAEAEARLLGSQKEIAENLMIVDLIRHDLHRVVSATTAHDTEMSNPDVGSTRGGVAVAKLFSVEETETVFHLVSVIEGCVNSDLGYTGWDVLARNLPPGKLILFNQTITPNYPLSQGV